MKEHWLSSTSLHKWKRGIRCHYCGKLRHIQKDCYERENNNSKMRKSSHRVDKSNVKKKDDDGIGLLA